MPQATANNIEISTLDDEHKSTIKDYKELDDKINAILEKISERKKKKSKK